MDENKFLENYKKKLLKEFSKNIINNFTVYNKFDLRVDDKEILKVLYTDKCVKRCIGTTTTGTISQCTRNAIENVNYCKIHMYKIGLVKTEEINIKIDCIENISSNKNIKNLNKKFINDSFYYTDDKYIYDMNTNNKVGYINDNEYILTNDPFILNENYN